MKAPKNLSSGFSLLELLVTLAIFSAIMTLLLSSIHQLSTQNKKIQAILSLRQEARILERVLRADIANVVYLKEFLKNGRNDQRKSGIYGENNSIGTIPADRIYLHVHQYSKFHFNRRPTKDPELYEVSYFLKELPEQKNMFQLRRREELYIDTDITSGERSITQILTSHLTRFNIRYFKAANTDAMDHWDSTSGADKIPTAVEIDFNLKNEAGETIHSNFQINLRPQMGSNVKWSIQ